MIATEHYGEIPLGVESAWPTILATPCMAIVPPLSLDADDAAHGAVALMMASNGPTGVIGSL
jgi:hypothetical protein